MHIILYLLISYAYSSFAEYFLHKYLLHKEVKGAEWSFKNHTVHHRSYNRTNFSSGQGKEEKYVNLVICLKHNLLVIIPTCIVMFPFCPQFSITLFCFGLIHHFIYNIIHSGIHLRHPIPWFIPKWLYMWAYWNHMMHHLYQGRYYAVSCPGADYIMGTTIKMSPADEELWKVELKHLKADKSQIKADFQSIHKVNFCILPKFFKRLESLCECGYIPPTPSGRDIKIGKKIVKMLTWIFIGDVRIIGHISDKPCLIASNHSSWKDVLIAHLITDNNLRIMAHCAVLSFLGGIFAPIMERYLGFVPIATAKGIDSAISLLSAGQTVFICPEGYSWENGKLHPFKTGAVRMAQGANVPITPICTKYGKYPGGWILKFPSPLQYLITAMCPFFRSGAIVNIGESYKVPAGLVRESTDLLYRQVEYLGGRI